MKAILKADRTVIVDVFPIIILDNHMGGLWRNLNDQDIIYDSDAIELIEYYGG